ncbi:MULTISPECIES: hypothetical protein [unclassified Colwellia]|jgi:hypothetical protein|uniref:hypothetical protein n=1 Tax=unclassified Colwellia TaxID=196834 RepID=UPI0015F57A87|nr:MULTISPECIES: hypothetical protein [unclassified Colwellia]MBA6379680.1 hypothetical protein [Colwellia sp. BRX10-7]MBA6388505.1 hypothetical protein [Colwellia sp. BRX10-2]MBA6402981.1 hypothetical protein [Colwellia sp. BRX10-5]MBA6406298.1 hypothetical protein [Colwellia sp. BRX10-1]
MSTNIRVSDAKPSILAPKFKTKIKKSLHRIICISENHISLHGRKFQPLDRNSLPKIMRISSDYSFRHATCSMNEEKWDCFIRMPNCELIRLFGKIPDPNLAIEFEFLGFDFSTNQYKIQLIENNAKISFSPVGIDQSTLQSINIERDSKEQLFSNWLFLQKQATNEIVSTVIQYLLPYSAVEKLMNLDNVDLDDPAFNTQPYDGNKSLIDLEDVVSIDPTLIREPRIQKLIMHFGGKFEKDAVGQTYIENDKYQLYCWMEYYCKELSENGTPERQLSQLAAHKILEGFGDNKKENNIGEKWPVYWKGSPDNRLSNLTKRLSEYRKTDITAENNFCIELIIDKKTE